MCCGNSQPRNKGIDLMAPVFSQFQPDGERYRSLNLYLKKLFGEKVYKVTLNGGMTCPNRDGHIGTGGWDPVTLRETLRFLLPNN